MPRLVVVLVVDQFRFDLLARYRAYFTDRGFARFARQGAAFTEARYLHATTETCPGHAVISTGTWGEENGLIANRRFDRLQDVDVGCAAPDQADFARNLLRPTMAEVIDRASGGAAKVIAISGKDSAAQILGGPAADGVFWPDRDWQFTTWQTDGLSLPGWAQRFNGNGPAEAYFQRAWLPLLPDVAQEVQGVDDVSGEMGADGRRTFPHSLSAGDSHPAGRFRSALSASPFADELLAQFSMAAIDGERLGADEVTDFLAVSFSASDRVSHRFGPDSREYMDTIVRLDRQIARLLDFIDAAVGLDRTLLVLTADHGVAPMPEVARRFAWGRHASRLPKADIDAAVERALVARFGPVPRGAWVAFDDFPNLYLDENALRRRGIDVDEASSVAREAVAALPGVQRAWTRDDLARLKAGRGAQTAGDRASLLSFYPQRSGHVVYEVTAYTVVAEVGSSHGSHWSYDARVPLIWLGRGIRPGTYDGPASPVDIAPTLYTLLGIGDPGTAGTVLHAMLESPSDSALVAARTSRGQPPHRRAGS